MDEKTAFDNGLLNFRIKNDEASQQIHNTDYGRVYDFPYYAEIAKNMIALNSKYIIHFTEEAPSDEQLQAIKDWFTKPAGMVMILGPDVKIYEVSDNKEGTEIHNIALERVIINGDFDFWSQNE